MVGRCDGWLVAATVGWSQRRLVGRSDGRSVAATVGRSDGCLVAAHARSTHVHGCTCDCTVCLCSLLAQFSICICWRKRLRARSNGWHCSTQHCQHFQLISRMGGQGGVAPYPNARRSMPTCPTHHTRTITESPSHCSPWQMHSKLPLLLNQLLAKRRDTLKLRSRSNFIWDKNITMFHMKMYLSTNLTCTVCASLQTSMLEQLRDQSSLS